MSNQTLVPLLIAFYVACCSCDNAHSGASPWKAGLEDPSLLFMSVDALTDVMVDNIFSPPAASRVYAYPLIAAYECARHADSSLSSLAGQLHGLSSLPEPADPENTNYQLAALEAFNTVGRQLIFTADMFDERLKPQIDALKALRIPASVRRASQQYGQAVAAAVLAWSGRDLYHELRSAPKYSVQFDNDANWVPTAPAFLDAVEPSWRQIRPMAIAGVDPYRIDPMPPFSMKPGAPFEQLVRQVYSVSQNLTESQKQVAHFWDCNPYTMHVTGHVMIATKKISPGGHWINIGIIALRQSGASFAQSCATLAGLSIHLFDAFIVCWDEKYRSKVVRPETVINKYIDDSWRPLLQTPPFPEYTSGHSVVSNAAAEWLTTVFGEPFPYTDDSEVRFGLPSRAFEGFRQAAREASVSRLYGGIHYLPAIDQGALQGQRLGKDLSTALATRLIHSHAIPLQ
jgi:hypothetical protein